MATKAPTQDHVTAQQRKGDFDPKTWWWSTLIFYIILFGILMGIFAYKEAEACGDIEDERIEIKVQL